MTSPGKRTKTDFSGTHHIPRAKVPKIRTLSSPDFIVRNFQCIQLLWMSSAFVNRDGTNMKFPCRLVALVDVVLFPVQCTLFSFLVLSFSCLCEWLMLDVVISVECSVFMLSWGLWLHPLSPLSTHPHLSPSAHTSHHVIFMCMSRKMGLSTISSPMAILGQIIP